MGSVPSSETTLVQKLATTLELYGTAKASISFQQTEASVSRVGDFGPQASQPSTASELIHDGKMRVEKDRLFIYDGVDLVT